MARTVGNGSSKGSSGGSKEREGDTERSSSPSISGECHAEGSSDGAKDGERGAKSFPDDPKASSDHAKSFSGWHEIGGMRLAERSARLAGEVGFLEN